MNDEMGRKMVVSQHFSDLGGKFVTPPESLALKLKSVQALVFDWDGVFNDGSKGTGSASLFSEADSMGTNMLRYGLWLQNARMPAAVVITGERNRTAVEFAEREHFNAIFAGIGNKRKAVEHICAEYNLSPDALACVFDDINDLSMAERCGVRCLVNRRASPLFREYVRDHGHCDYITGQRSGQNAVREISELFLGLCGLFGSVVDSRTAVDQPYRDYLERRQAIVTRVYGQVDDAVVEVKTVA